MKVETYEQEEVTGEMGNMAADAEAAELIEKLGLDGQRGLLVPDTCTRFPYRLMSPAEHKVFSLCFPERVKLEDFSAGIIPVRVLQVAAFCKDSPPSGKWAGLYVWHSGSAKEDPLLVGHTEQWGGQFYLLARWGDALAPFEELTAKAKRIWITKAKAKCAKEVSDWRADMVIVDTLADELLLTGKITGGNNGYTLASM